MSRVASSLIIIIALAGCGESHRRTLCSDEPDLCSEEGASRCDREEAAIEVCQIGLTGCLAWTVEATCGGAGSCRTAGEEPLCVCDDECDTSGEARCRGDAVEVCAESDTGCLYWREDEDCAALGQRCDDQGGEPTCLEGCPAACPPDEGRCAGMQIERCLEDPEGCWVWDTTEDCGAEGLFCDATGGEPRCVDECVDQCELGRSECLGESVYECLFDDSIGCTVSTLSETCQEEMFCEEVGRDAACTCPEVCDSCTSRCSGDVLQVYGETDSGCLGYVDEVDCAALGLTCDDSVDPAECRTGGGDACDEARVLWDFPAVIAGGDFSADFGDDQIFGHDACLSRAASPEAVFAVDVEEGGAIYMMEWADVDIVFSVQSACDPDGDCLLSLDDFSWDGLVYEPEAPGRYWVIVETSGPATARASYEIEISVFYPEDCGDGVDNDLDELVDCADNDCFGDPTHCALEADCADDADNDGDGLVDCADSDCAASTDCSPLRGVYEVFDPGEPLDLSGTSIVFTPDASSPQGYSWTATTGETDFPVTPGTRTTTTLTLADDSFEAYRMTLLDAFEFYGVRYDAFFVSSNGVVTFDDGTNSFAPSLGELFSQPSIAALWSDLDPSDGDSPGAVTIDEDGSSVVITFEGVLRWSGRSVNDVQIILWDDGTIELHLVQVAPPSDRRSTIVGLSSGVGVEPWPPEVNFIERPPEVDCDDGLDNDGDGLTDCADVIDCGGEPSCVEDCGDGLDNDADGLADCDDPDCFGDEASCGAELNCTDGLDNDGDGLTDCDDSDDCDDPWICDPWHGYWERFDRFGWPDLGGHSILFTPDDASPEGYSWAASPIGSATFPVLPGSGLTSTPLALGDDDFVEVPLTHMASFTFYGVGYTSLFVSSNGYVTFGEGSTSNSLEVWDHFALPGVAALRRDLDPSVAGTVTVDELADQVAVTFEGVPRFEADDPAAEPNSFQIILDTGGVIALHVLTTSVTNALVGLSNGVGNGTWPPETNFVP